ncbi:MAG: sulfur carrier protein ThiS [Anaerocolumna sp.]
MMVNGVSKFMEKEMTLEQYLLKEGFNLARIVVEVNGSIIPKSNYPNLILSDADRVEIIHFVGGG